MSKQKKTFAQKMQKTGIEVHEKCATCGDNLVPHKIANPVFSEEKGSYKLPLKKTLICKCNEKNRKMGRNVAEKNGGTEGRISG